MESTTSFLKNFSENQFQKTKRVTVTIDPFTDGVFIPPNCIVSIDDDTYVEEGKEFLDAVEIFKEKCLSYDRKLKTQKTTVMIFSKSLTAAMFFLPISLFIIAVIAYYFCAQLRFCWFFETIHFKQLSVYILILQVAIWLIRTFTKKKIRV